MSPRVKKLIGTLAILAWIVIYSLIAAGVGVAVASHFPHGPWFVRLLYYAIAGTLWIVPVGLMLPWMYREPKA